MIVVPNETLERRSDRGGETIYSAKPSSRHTSPDAPGPSVRRDQPDGPAEPPETGAHPSAHPATAVPETRPATRAAVPDSTLEPGAAPSRGERVGAALRTWRGELAKTGGPNALLWYRDTLDGTLDLTNAHPTGVSMLMAGNRVRLSDLVREKAAFHEALATARRIRNKALDLHDDHGLDTGFLCIGMAGWQLPGTSRRPQAPIMLRSARLHAVDPSEGDLEVELSSRVEINPVFLHYMASEQGVRLRGDALADLAHSTGRFDPFPVYRELARVLAGVPGFTITDRRVISTFAVSKMAMVADLAAFADRLAGNDVIAALAGDPDAARALRADGEAGLAESKSAPVEPDLDRESLVLDADPSQQDVVDAARSGRHVLVDAARGTGATQTLANVAAALVAGDQRVLYISENARQLVDFMGHLDRAGLGELVLDARDPHELRRTVSGDIIARVEGRRDESAADRPSAEANAAGDRPDEGEPARPDEGGRAEKSEGVPAGPPHQELAELRSRLLAHSAVAHAPRAPWNVTVFEAQTALARLSARPAAPTSRVRIPPDALRALSRQRLRELAAEAARAAAEGAWTTTAGADDPWWAARLATDEDARRAVGLAAELAGPRLTADRDVIDATLADAGLPPGRSVEDWREAMDLLVGVRETLMVFRPEIYAAPLDEFVEATDPASGHRAGWWSRGGAYKKEARALALPHARIDSLHDALRRAQDQRDRWSALTDRDEEPHVPEGLDHAVDTLAALEHDVAWLDAVFAGPAGAPALQSVPLDRLRTRLAALAAHADRAYAVPGVRDRLDRLADAGLGELVDDLARRHVAPDRVADEAEFVWWLSVLDAVAAEDPEYGAYDGPAVHELAVDFAERDRALHAARADQVLRRARAHARVEASTRTDQVNLLRAVAAQGRAPRPIRTLLADCGDVVAAAAPIWVMSPLTLASVVPTHLAFDAVLIDDAARMPVAHAVSALARGVRVVAAGDLQGLGPRHFETVAQADEVEEAAESVSPVSVLQALAAHLPLRHLTRAYGDADARLVSFATAERQEDVWVWPAAGGDRALRLIHPDAGSSDAGPSDAGPSDTGAPVEDDAVGARAESLETARVVEVVLDHLRRRPGDSLAVVTIAAGPAADLDRQLRLALAHDARAASAPTLAEQTPERLLVTTVDRAAGATRDTVVFATGLVPLAGGQVLAPERLNRPDGNRLVDTVAGIARHRLDVICPLTAGALSRIPAASRGQARLAALLDHAEHDGRRTDATPREEHSLLGELAARLRSEGLTVHEGYGVGTARIDLAVEDPYVPGNLVVAVLSDGARQVGGSTVRERDRLWVQQLTRLGWRCVSAAGTDIFRDPAPVVARVVAAVRGGGA